MTDSTTINNTANVTAEYDSISVAAVPLATEWADIEKNLKKCDEIIANIRPETDIIVLPELFTTGFIVDTQLLENVAEPPLGRTAKWAAAKARERDMAVAGSYLTVRDGKYYNTSFFVEPSGNATFYDKHHLFCLSPEASLYGQGESEMPVIPFRGWNIAMIICYDLRFPVWCRNKGEKYDLMLVPANWPTARGYAWQHLLIARAIENQTPWVGADRAGSDDYGLYDGLAMICDARGEVVASASTDNPEAVLYASFSRENLLKFRKRLPVGSDADSFSLISEHKLLPPLRHKF